MPTQVEYALMATNVYAASPTVRSEQNEVPLPDGWAPVDERINPSTGFMAHDLGPTRIQGETLL